MQVFRLWASRFFLLRSQFQVHFLIRVRCPLNLGKHLDLDLFHWQWFFVGANWAKILGLPCNTISVTHCSLWLSWLWDPGDELVQELTCWARVWCIFCVWMATLLHCCLLTWQFETWCVWHLRKLCVFLHIFILNTLQKIWSRSMKIERSYCNALNLGSVLFVEI